MQGADARDAAPRREFVSSFALCIVVALTRPLYRLVSPQIRGPCIDTELCIARAKAVYLALCVSVSVSGFASPEPLRRLALPPTVRGHTIDDTRSGAAVRPEQHAGACARRACSRTRQAESTDEAVV